MQTIKDNVFLPELSEAFGTNVLTGVLNSCQQVGNKLVDGALVLHRSRDTLSYFDLVALARRKQENIKSEEWWR